MDQEISCASIYVDFLDCWSEWGEFLFSFFILVREKEKEKMKEDDINLDDYVCDFV